MSSSRSTKNKPSSKAGLSATQAHKGNGPESLDHSQVDEECVPQGESGEEVLLQQLLENNTRLQLIEGKLSRIRHELDVARQVMACQSHGIVYIDTQQKIVYANTIFCNMTKQDAQRLEGKKLFQFVMLPKPNQSLGDVLQKALQMGSWHGQVFLKKENNGQVPVTLALNYRNKDVHKEEKKGFVCQFFSDDTSANTQTGLGSSSLFTYDPLTGLPDRHSCQQYLASCIKKARAKRSRVGVVYMDIDHFKRFNRIQGPSVGDKLLCYISSLLRECSNAAGVDFVSRLGGDQFAIILPSPTNAKLAEKLADKILQKFQRPISIKSRDIFVTLSIGISMYPNSGKNPPELLHNADTAMEMAKTRGGNTTYRWSSKLDDLAAKNQALENDLIEAVDNNELVNYYQPQINLTNGVIVGMEALARWKHPVHGFISPAIFVPIAENIGLIDKLSFYLIQLACQQGRKWLSMGSDFTMAVNISGRMMQQNNLFDKIMDCLKSTGFPATSFELELTESVLIENIDNTMELIDKCRGKGIKLAIDDFGTGYSSLSYLQRFAVDKIKIDRSFITGVTTNADDATITLAIIAMAKKLNFQVLAEGVETEGHLSFLQENKCDECQGFLFNKPLTAKQMTSTLLHDSSVAMRHRRIIDKFFSIKAKLSGKIK